MALVCVCVQRHSNFQPKDRWLFPISFFMKSRLLLQIRRINRQSLYYGIRMRCPKFGTSAHTTVFSSVCSEETLPLGEFSLVPRLCTSCNAEVKICRRHVTREHLTPGPQTEIGSSVSNFLWWKFNLMGKPRGDFERFSHLASSPRIGLRTNWYLQVVISSVLKRFL